MDPNAFGIEERRLILRIEHIRVAGDSSGSIGGLTADANVRGGELALVRVDQVRQGTAFADLCVGLITPREGRVQFLGHDWAKLPMAAIGALRGRIGRVFGEQNWLDHLSVLDNILLPKLHHTGRSLAELRDEAARLAGRFSLPGIPIGYPRDCAPGDLQRSACVRAFLGNPSMVILEDPTSGVFPGIMESLINTIRDARSAGAAVIWLTSERAVWGNASLPVTRRYVAAGHEVVEVTGRQ